VSSGAELDATPREPGSLSPAPGPLPAPTLDGRPDDEELTAALDAARAGDEQGFLVIYRTLQPLLLRYLRVRSTDVAEDVAAESWLQVVRDLERFRGDAGDFRRWLFTIARNRAIDAARATASRPSVPVADVRDIDGVPTVSAEVEALQVMSTQRALELVASLPADQAELVALRVIAGLDVATVADLVGKTPGAVRVAVHRALRALSRDPRVEVM
jgi:RNA polymerase sigma-70 factor (ECF subfamily)